MALSNLTYGFVTGRYLAAVADAVADDDRLPEGIPMAGEIIFRPNAQYILKPDGTPDPFTVLPQGIKATLDADGYLTHNGERGIWLISTDAPGDPVGWNYTVDFNLSLFAGGPKINFGPFSIEVPSAANEAEPHDLTKASPVPGSGGTGIVRGVGVSYVELVGNTFVFHMTDGTQQETPAPVGEGGVDTETAEKVNVLSSDVATLKDAQPTILADAKAYTETYALPASDPSLTALPDVEDMAYAHAWADSTGRVALGIRADGAVEAEGKPIHPAPRRSPIALTLSGSTAVGSGQDTRSALSVRYPFSPTVNVRVKAIHIRNFNDRSSFAYGAITVNGVWLGKHRVDHAGLSGSFAATPTRISDGFSTDTAGTEYVIGGLDIPLDAHSEHLLSLGYTCDANQPNHKGVGTSWTTANPADASVITPASMTRETLSPLDVWIEVEHYAPILAWLGDSITCGVGGTLPAYGAPGVLHGRANGVMPMLYCHSGSAMPTWTGGNTLWKYAKYDGLSRPDTLLWELGRNDLIDAADVATLRTRFNNLYARVSQYISPNIYMTTVTPKADDETSADGKVRRDWNDVIRKELSGGAVRGVFDVGRTMERAGGTNLDLQYDSRDGLHLNDWGSVKFAQAINQPLAH